MYPLPAASCQSRVASCQFRSPVHTRATHQSHSAHHVSLGSDPKTCQPGLKRRQESVAGCTVSEWGTAVRNKRRGFPTDTLSWSRGALLPVRRPAGLRNAGRVGQRVEQRTETQSAACLDRCVATAIRHPRTGSPKWMGLLGQKKGCKQQKRSSRIRSVARAA